MPVVLLLLGTITTVAGLILVGSGVFIREGAFDTEVLTPGTIAAVGGLLLVGLGLAIRELRRIEQALAARPAARALDQGHRAIGEASDARPRLPEEAEQRFEPQTSTAAALAEPAAFERVPPKLAPVQRVEAGEFADTADLPAAHEVAGFEETIAQVRSVAGGGRMTSAAPGSARGAPRLETKSRPAADKDKISVFNTFWPAAPRRDKQGTPGKAAAPPLSAAAGTSPSEPAVPAPPTAASPISVLKSGVVEGMAYTLYSDGSIEAQLPQGTLRFGSISALRNHIENSA